MPAVVGANAQDRDKTQQNGSYPPGWPKHEDGLTGTRDDYDTEE